MFWRGIGRIGWLFSCSGADLFFGGDGFSVSLLFPGLRMMGKSDAIFIFSMRNRFLGKRRFGPHFFPVTFFGLGRVSRGKQSWEAFWSTESKTCRPHGQTNTGLRKRWTRDDQQTMINRNSTFIKNLLLLSACDTRLWLEELGSYWRCEESYSSS